MKQPKRMRPKPPTPMERARVKAGVTLPRLARIIGVPYPTVRIIDAGLGRGYSAGTKIKIAAALDADPLELFPELAKIVNHVPGLGYVVVLKNTKGRT